MKRKQWFIYLPLSLLVLLLSGCKDPQQKARETDTMTSGVVSISADESFQPVVEQEINVFEGLYPYASIIPYYGSEVETLNLLLQDSVRLAISARPLTQAEKEGFNARKFFPREIKMAVDGIAVIANKENPDSLMSVADLRKILTGEATRWTEIYPDSKLNDIQVVFDNPNSSTVRFAIDSICRDKPLSPDLKAQKNIASVFDYVSHTPGAIGILGVSWVLNEKDSTNLSFSEMVKVMAISRDDQPTPQNSYLPYQGYVAVGEYPLSRNVYIILNDPRGGLISGFTSFVTSFRGQYIIQRAGMVPATQPVRVVNIRDEI